MTAQAHPERIPDATWSRRPEPYLVPVPAARYTAAELYGRRVVLHDPGQRCWRNDVVVVVGPYWQSGATLVGVVDEYDWHRGRRDRTKIPTAEVRLDRIWVEELHENLDDVDEDLIPPTIEIPAQQPHLPPGTLRVDPGRPPVRRCQRGNRLASAPVGSRVVCNTPAGFVRGFRLISQPHLVERQGPNLTQDLSFIDAPLWLQCYTICPEDEYFAWAATGTTPPGARYEQCGSVHFE